MMTCALRAAGSGTLRERGMRFCLPRRAGLFDRLFFARTLKRHASTAQRGLKKLMGSA